MCRRVTCNECGRATFAGCGMHVEQVLAGVPEDKRCSGHSPAPKPSEPGKARKGWWPF
jgi:hypothetical protein